MYWKRNLGMSKERVIDRFEVEEMLIRADCLRTKALIGTLWNTGHRVTEVIGIKKNDIWLDEKYLYFRMKVGKRRQEWIHTIKIPISALFSGHIIEHWQSIEGNEDLLFPITRQYVDKLLKALNPDIHAHLFRHSLATRFAEKGASKWELDAWFGWSERQNTAGQYVSKGTGMLDNLASKID